MHFLLTPVGSSGDVFPFIGIGRTLRRRGHEVTIVTSEPFGDASRAAGLEFVAGWSATRYREIVEHPDLWHPRRGIRLVLATAARESGRAYALLSDLHRPGRTVLVGHGLAFATRVFEERHGVPAATIQLAPSAFRSDHEQPPPAPGIDVSGAPRWVKRSMWWLIDRLLLDRAIGSALDELRAGVGLPPVDRVFRGWIHSPQLVVAMFPAWFGRPQPDWPPGVRQTDFPLFDVGADDPLDAEVEAWLASGDPPVVFTPGSANTQATRFFEAAAGAAGRLGRRAILLTPFRGQLPRELPAGVRHVAYAPLARLLPRSAAVVHHGGIGTSAQGLAAGVPQLVMPMGFDQPDNAARLMRLGVGRWIVPGSFSGERVAAALDALLTRPSVAAACRTYRERLARRDGLELASDALEALGARAAMAG